MTAVTQQRQAADRHDNLTLDDLHNPEDTAHSRIYDRLLSMCVPVRFTGENFRQETAQRKMESMKKLIPTERSIAYGR